MKPIATQKDVAKEAGVSQATVSLVLSGAGGGSIPAVTILKVNEAVSALGYSPNYLARALRTNQTMTIACLVPDITNPFYPSLVRGVQSIAESAGYDVIIVNTNGDRDRELHYLDMARQGRVDGIVGVFFGLTIHDMKPLIEAGTPIVRLEASVKNGGAIAVDDVFIDNHRAAEQLTEFLMSKGHKSIAMIAGRAGLQSVRVDGYRKGLEANDLSPRIELADAFTEQGGARATAALLDNNTTRPTAIIAVNDLMAIGVMQALRDKNISIPNEIAVAGFDDIPSARLVSPALTTVAQFQDKLGVEAARSLIERLNGSITGPGRAKQLGYEIIERTST